MGKFNTHENWLDVLASYGKKKKFPKGTSVFFQDDEVKNIALIISGRLDAWVHSESGLKTWVDSFRPTEFVGHVSLFTQSPIQYDVAATSDTVLLFIPVDKIEAVLRNNINLPQEFSQDLATRLEVMTNRLIETVALSAKGRVCAELMRLSEPIGIAPDKLIIRPLPVFVDLAVRINSTRETVSRTVNKLQKKGVLSREPGSIVIHEPDALRKLMQ
ncbi:MAG: Crp/Fnr family transcriptional regulator [Litorimonas sp.]